MPRFGGTVHAATDLEQYFSAVSENISVKDDADWPWEVTTDGVKSTNPGRGYSDPSASALELTFAKGGALSFTVSTDGTSYSNKYQYYLNGDSSNPQSMQPQYNAGSYTAEVKDVAVSKGDTLTIYYYRADTPSYSGTPTRDIVLSDFNFEVRQTVSFPNIQNGADFVFAEVDAATYQPTGKQYTVANNQVTVPDGLYVWQASKFGYEDASGLVTVSGADVTVNDTLKEKQKHKLTVEVTGLPADAKATVIIKHDSEEMTAEADGSYQLTAATYDYIVKAKGYTTVKGQVTIADKDETLAVKMEEGLTEWEGQIADAFDGGDGTAASPYEIANGDQLALMAKVYNESSTNSTYRGKHFVLTSDIELGGVEFTPIGNNQSYYFNGTFDGQGNTIYGLNATTDGGMRYAGLFGYVQGSYGDVSVIKNLTVRGKSGTSYAPNNPSGAGGIAGVIKFATIENCVNYADVTNTASSSYCNSGGIVGYIYGGSSEATTVKNCANFGTISSTGSSGRTGGIVGGTSQATIQDCYNAGAVEGKNYSGGIDGYFSTGDKFYRCYNRGQVTGSGSYTGALLGYKYSGSTTFEKCAYLKGSAANGKAIGSGLSPAASELKEFASADEAADIITFLGDAFIEDNTPNINEGFPILAWQEDPAAKELKEAKAKAVKELSEYKDPADYREAQQQELADAVEAGTAAINAAADKDAVAAALEAAKAEIDKIKTDAQMTEEEAQALQQAKDEAIEALKAYKNAADYREAQQQELAAAIEAGTAAINAAADADAVAAALEAAKAEIDKIETDEQITEQEDEELEAAKEAAIQVVEEAAEAAKEGVDEETAAQIDAAAAAAIDQISAIEDYEDIDKAAEAASSATGVMNTLQAAVIKEAAAKALADKKAAAEEELMQNLAENIDKADSAQAVNAALEGIKAINAAENEEAVDAALAAAKGTIQTLAAEGTAAAYKVTGLKAKAKKRKFTVQWDKVEGAAGYQVEYKLKKAKTWKSLSENTADTTIKTKKLKKNKKYSFRVRTVSSVNDKTIYGEWSQVKTAKCKK
ncbi:MAG: fibronectin type III domain-containing protein [Bacillota bacterium]|nr:fibronectin type III domain-containing protein [Bacillota bacterium]